MKYQLWVDLYDLINCDVVSPGSTIWVEVSMGKHQVGVKDKILFKFKHKTKSYRYRGVMVDALKGMTLPCDFS